MIVGDLIDSEIMQLIPLSFAQDMVNQLMGKGQRTDEVVKGEDLLTSKNNTTYEPQKREDKTYIEQPKYDSNFEKANNVKQSSVNVEKFELHQFETSDNKVYNESIELIHEIPIDITVELGRTTRKIGEILEYGPGTIIELDKLLGEPLEIYANGKFIAKGEVVVIDDNFGIRITDIISPSKRISKN